MQCYAWAKLFLQSAKWQLANLQQNCVTSHTHTHTTIYRPSWILSRTTPVSQHQEGKTDLNLVEQEIVSGSGISWAICKSAPHPRQPRQHPITQFFTGQMPFLPPNRQCQYKIFLERLFCTPSLAAPKGNCPVCPPGYITSSSWQFLSPRQQDRLPSLPKQDRPSFHSPLSDDPIHSASTEAACKTSPVSTSMADCMHSGLLHSRHLPAVRWANTSIVFTMEHNASVISAMTLCVSQAIIILKWQNGFLLFFWHRGFPQLIPHCVIRKFSPLQK